MSGVTAVVLAGARAGAADPMAQAAGVAHKALLPVGGIPMLLRVLRTLRACPQIARIVVVAHQPDGMLRAVEAPYRVLGRPEAASPARSAAAALAEFGTPLLITTADHALLSPAMVAHMLREAPAVDAVAAVARADVIRAAYPDAARTWLRLRDGDVSFCHLFLLRNARAQAAIAFWQRIESLRKQKLAMAWAVGPLAAARYAARRLTLADGLQLLSRRAGATLGAVALPYAESAIDIDKPADLILAERILATRQKRGAGASVPSDVPRRHPAR